MKNKNLDTILKSLGDFDPQAKPNWDGFLAENESQLTPAGETPVSNAGKTVFMNNSLKYAGIAAAVVVGLLIGWYFIGSSQGDTQPFEQQNSLNIETQKVQPDETGRLSNEKAQMTKPEINHTLITDQPGISQPFQLETEDPGLSSEPELVIPDNQPEMFEIQETGQGNTVIIKDTVFVKKKIYVTDTIRRK